MIFATAATTVGQAILGGALGGGGPKPQNYLAFKKLSAAAMTGALSRARTGLKKIEHQERVANLIGSPTEQILVKKEKQAAYIARLQANVKKKWTKSNALKSLLAKDRRSRRVA